MKSALENYLDEYLTTPDYNLENPMSQSFFYQEGGFAKFVQ